MVRSRDAPPDESADGWGTIAISGVCAASTAARLKRGRGSMTLTPDGSPPKSSATHITGRGQSPSIPVAPHRQTEEPTVSQATLGNNSANLTFSGFRERLSATIPSTASVRSFFPISYPSLSLILATARRACAARP